jgi:carboxymethylenebutenolidase
MLNKSHLTASIVALTLVISLIAQAQDQARRKIPPPNETATQTLKDSPRHGEWVEVALPGSDTKIKTWVVYPERKDKAGVVLVIHEIFGLTDWVRAVADQLAADGFIAVAPDFLSEQGGTESLGENARQEIRKITPEQQAKILDAVRGYTLKLPSANGKTASIGFCWGGSASFNYATHQPALNAAVVYYGTAPRENEKLAKIKCPVLGLYGGNDNRVNSTLEATSAGMKESNKSFTQHVYEGAGHGFLRQQSGQDGANMKASEQAWKETVEFLKKNLE